MNVFDLDSQLIRRYQDFARSFTTIRAADINPSENFRVLQKNEIAKHGEYRTACLVLAAYDTLMQQGLRPRTEGWR